MKEFVQVDFLCGHKKLILIANRQVNTFYGLFYKWYKARKWLKCSIKQPYQNDVFEIEWKCIIIKRLLK